MRDIKLKFHNYKLFLAFEYTILYHLNKIWFTSKLIRAQLDIQSINHHFMHQGAWYSYNKIS